MATEIDMIESSFELDVDSSFDDENGHPNQKKSAAPTKGKQAAKKPSASASAKSNGSKNGKTIEETYQKKTQLEHILLRPDIGRGRSLELDASGPEPVVAARGAAAARRSRHPAGAARPDESGA